MDYNKISISDELRSGIYILQENIHINTLIFKIGKTDRGLFKRFSEYDKGSIVYYYIPINYSGLNETQVLNKLRKETNIKNRTDIGKEYFEGEYKLIEEIINKTCLDKKKDNDYNINEFINYCNLNHKIISPLNYKKPKKEIIINNSIYECKRCKYSTEILGNIYQHLQRKRPCQSLFSETPISVLLQEFKQYDKSDEDINGVKVFKCKFCEKPFYSRSSKCNHQHICSGKQYYEKIQLLTLRNKELEEKDIKRELEFNKLKDDLIKIKEILVNYN